MPLSFTRGPVTIAIGLAYLIIWTISVYIHLTVPEPGNDLASDNVNVNEAFFDLKSLTKEPHPYNSHANDAVRNWLLLRIEAILNTNNASFAVETDFGTEQCSLNSSQDAVPTAYIFNDLISNSTFTASSTPGSESVYFEGTNVMVYIVGTKDSNETWWRCVSSTAPVPHGILVNAHYDSVSTGYGATDDGVGVVTILQLLRYFTTPGNQPQRGVVLLLNNGEEDYLNGARAFTQHPLSDFVGEFLNLEGAGAGGRAALFRSTDTDITHHYKSSFPFGTVVSDDAFKRRVIRSETDYAVFTTNLGKRGLDVAFMEPRARYHTKEDSTKFTSRSSIYHMLTAALKTTKSLANTIDAECEDGGCGRAVWFDLFGKGFVLFRLTSLFAVSVSLLVTVPIALLVAALLLRRSGKWYPFMSSHSAGLPSSAPTARARVIKFGGWKGFFRFPLALIMASSADVILALWIHQANPYIVYSSSYVVWCSFMTTWFLVIWFFLRAADYIRPTALQRPYGVLWLTVIFWILLVVATVFQDQSGISGTYSIVFYFAALTISALLVYLEFLQLPSIEDYKRSAGSTHYQSAIRSPSIGPTSSPGEPTTRPTAIQWADEPSESSHLLAEERPHRPSSTYGVVTRGAEPSITPIIHSELATPFGDEQLWSGSMSPWLWLPQFGVLLFPVLLVTQLGLFVTSALAQTSADGNSALTVFLSMAAVSCLALAPVAPFVHRISNRVSLVFVVILIGSLVYNLGVDPFSADNPLKVYFIQQLDLDTGINSVSLTGLDGYVQDIIAELPSASGQDVQCGSAALPKNGLTTCSWSGIPPDIVRHESVNLQREETGLPFAFREENLSVYEGIGPSDWVSVSVSKPKEKSKTATILVSGMNTKSCRLRFSTPVTSYTVKGAAAQDPRFPRMPPQGAREIRLWSREWEKSFEVEIKWQSEVPPDGSAVCIWSDASKKGTIPALDEVSKYMPSWSIVSKLADGLVEGKVAFMI